MKKACIHIIEDVFTCIVVVLFGIVVLGWFWGGFGADR